MRIPWRLVLLVALQRHVIYCFSLCSSLANTLLFLAPGYARR